MKCGLSVRLLNVGRLVTHDLRCAAMMALLSIASAGHAQISTNPSITMVVPYPAGGSADTAARLFAEKLSLALDQPVIVDNRAGAEGNLAIKFVAQAKPDGRTLLFTNPIVVYNHLITPLDVDALAVLDPLGKLTEFNFVLLQTAKRSPVNFQEFLAWSKSAPEGVNCGGGAGSPTIACQMLKMYGGVPLTVVPYKGNAPALRDLMGGHLDIMFEVSNAAAAQVGNNKVVALATTGDGRSEAPFSQLPALSKTMPQFKLSSWMGVFVPTGVPPEVMKRLENALKKVLNDPDLIARFAEGGLTVKYENSQQFRASLLPERKHYEQVFRDLKMGK